MKFTITALKWLPSQPNRVWIYLDGGERVAVNLTTAAGFKAGDCIAADTVDGLRSHQRRDDAYRCAIRLLARRDHSTYEIRQKLVHRGFDPDAINDALERLIENKYMNDQAFAASWINYRIKTAPRSRRMMRRELRQKGLDHTQIEPALANLDEHELATACIQRKRRRWQRMKGSTRRLKMLAHLSQKGFSYEVSRSVVDNYCDDAD